MCIRDRISSVGELINGAASRSAFRTTEMCIRDRVSLAENDIVPRAVSPAAG